LFAISHALLAKVWIRALPSASSQTSLSYIFTARRSYASAVLGAVILSVCPSVRPSVRLSVCHTRAL